MREKKRNRELDLVRLLSLLFVLPGPWKHAAAAAVRALFSSLLLLLLCLMPRAAAAAALAGCSAAAAPGSKVIHTSYVCGFGERKEI